jgi:hypothetical protein
VAGAEPELVLVLELVGTVDSFYRAVSRVTGLEWLADVALENLPPDEDFHEENDEELARPLAGQMYLVMANRRAVDELIALWGEYVANPEFKWPWGYASVRDVFLQLRSIRAWDRRDRLEATGILDEWRRDLDMNRSPVPAEVELWYREDPEARRMASESTQSLVDRAGGRVVNEADIQEIRYHALIAELPRNAVEVLIEGSDVDLVLLDDVMFLRPIGQADVSPVDEEAAAAFASGEPHVDPSLAPVVALLDGLPMANHPALENGIVIDDPEDWAGDYPVAERVHGTAMASLILRGDLTTEPAFNTRPIYARPILKPDPRAFGGTRPERAPFDQPLADVVHRAVRRMLEGEGDQPPTAPEVRVINVSVCDPSRPYEGFISPLARMLDWLSDRYGILFIVSAGNHTLHFDLAESRDEFAGADISTWQPSALNALSATGALRRVLSPAEAINALTVGASHEDAAGEGPFDTGINVIESSHLPAVYNPVGPGVRRSIKPDVLMQGGRRLLELSPGAGADPARAMVVQGSFPPGHLVAVPGPPIRPLVAMSAGTSNAAALTSRACGHAFETISDVLREAADRDEPETVHWGPILKAAVCHEAHEGDALEILTHALGLDGQQRRATVGRFVGYGRIDQARLASASDERVTMLGWGTIEEEDGQEFDIPLPTALSGQAFWRRLTVTLAWMSPINPRHHLYRRASLWFDLPFGDIGVSRSEADWRAVMRGTLQHEVFEGTASRVLESDQAIPIRVNCRADAGHIDKPIPYGLVVTLEVAPEIGIQIYEEIQTRLRPGIRVRPR